MQYGARLAGKKIIITGAATGIGRASAVRICAEGGIVLGVDVNEGGLAETVGLASATAGHGGRIATAKASVADEAAVKQVFGAFIAKEGGLDGLVNMAGILRAWHTTETSLQQFMDVININLVGCFLACREALPHLEASGGGAIVNAASTSSFFGHPYMTAYAASKGAVMSMTRTLAWEYIKRGVRVNAVAPGGIATPMTEQMANGFPEGADMSLIAHLARPDWKFGAPEDIAFVITMLLSDDAKHMNGEVVRIDGGTHS